MEEEYHEKNAQLQYENFKLHEELALFKRLALSLEENYNLLSSTFLEKENHIKCLEQRINEISEVLKDKDNSITSLESENEEYINLNKILEAKIVALKQNSIERQKLFESKEEDFQQSFSILENKNKQLLSELRIKNEEATFRDATLRHMQQKNQELENEKLEILAMQERILRGLNIENVVKMEPTEEFVLSYHDYNMNRFDRGTLLSEQNFLPYDSPSTNLKEEILEVEIQEKNRLIIQLKNTLAKMEEKINFAFKLINQLGTKMNQKGLLAPNRRNDFNLDYPLFSDIVNILLELIVWSENESEEKKEEEKLGRGLGESGVETSQPSMPPEVFRGNLVIETSSIASQTDPLETLSPIFGFGSSNERSSESGKNDSEGMQVQAPSVLYLTNLDQRRSLFHDHKTSHLDMDFFKSCRKLSVLPEEDTDDFVLRRTFKKNRKSKCVNPKIKTFSADDVHDIEKTSSITKGTCSLSNVDYAVTDQMENETSDVTTDSSSSSNSVSGEPTASTYEGDEGENLKLVNLIRNSRDSPPKKDELADRRPLSTCRPLRLPCEKRDLEVRVASVRFDLTDTANNRRDLYKMAWSNERSKNTETIFKIKDVPTASRFGVEKIEEIEFLKCLRETNDERTTPTAVEHPKTLYRQQGQSDCQICSDIKKIDFADGAFSSKKRKLSADDFKSNAGTSPNDADLLDVEPRRMLQTKHSRMYKSPTFVKNLSSLEILTSILETSLGKFENLQDEKLENRGPEEKEEMEVGSQRQSWDASSSSETLTYATVTSHLVLGSDGESDTYVTVASETSSALDKKISDLSENSSSPYNTPPEMSSGGFCTPPDDYLAGTDPRTEFGTKRGEYWDENGFPSSEDEDEGSSTPVAGLSASCSHSEPPDDDVVLNFVNPGFYDLHNSLENLDPMFIVEDDSRSQNVNISRNLITGKSGVHADREIEKLILNMMNLSPAAQDNIGTTGSRSTLFSAEISRSSSSPVPEGSLKKFPPYPVAEAGVGENRPRRRRSVPSSPARDPMTRLDESQSGMSEEKSEGGSKRPSPEGKSIDLFTSHDCLLNLPENDGISVKVEEKARNRGMKSNEFSDEASECKTFVRSCILIGKSRSISSEEESNGRFESMSFAFKTDAITFEKRLNLLKRKRDQAVTNVVAEVAAIKNKLQEVQRSPVFDVDHFNAVSGLMKELDFLLKAARQLVSSAEAYGYAQHEGRTLEFVTLMVEHVEKVDIQKKEILMFLNKLMTDREKSCPFSMGSPKEGVFQRKSSAASAPFNSGPDAWKRRASIATLPESGENSISWSSSFRVSAKKEKSFSKPGRNSICAGANDESSAEILSEMMKSRRPKSTHFQILEVGVKEKFAVGSEGAEGSESSTSGTWTRTTSSDFPRILSFSQTKEHLNKLINFGLKDSARQILDFSEMAWRATRFRGPENVIELIQFYTSWTLVFLMCLIFSGGLVAGLADCFIYLDFRRSSIWFAALSLFIFLRRFYRLFFGFALACFFALIAFAFWLAVSLPENLSAREIDNLFRFFGFVLEVRYLNGPPPI